MSKFKRCECAGDCSHHYHFKFMLGAEMHRGSTFTSNARDADRLIAKRRQTILNERAGIVDKQPERIRLSTHIAKYVEFTRTRNITVYKDARVLNRLVEEIGDKQITLVKPEAIEEWQNARLDDVSESTVNRELHIVKACFSKAVEWLSLRVSPAAKVKEFKTDDVRTRWFSDTELKIVLALPFVGLIGRVTLITLSRLSEVLNLRVSDIGANAISVRQKGGKRKLKRITPALRAMLLANAHASGWVFGEDRFGGKPPTQANATKRVERAFALAGILDASHHTFRHTGVTLQMHDGISMKNIQELGGWSSMRMLERYGHASDAEAERAITGIEDHLAEVEAPPAQ